MQISAMLHIKEVHVIKGSTFSIFFKLSQRYMCSFVFKDFHKLLGFISGEILSEKTGIFRYKSGIPWLILLLQAPKIGLAKI